ncbi:helix-turn-helix domain-containing protein [Cohnella faecalis]|uniref:Helix-turn-helix domain-containing protein n=1 Tax=Cohnella faecalis TaxID=2315694 RepID=A0A398CIL4_9BACL|nr:AraC family transcriptional regulator [Cohnella faecalis]RIE00698.1 helix-turn-helix domain-containing protein [Cohnella faecalis]
MRLYYLPRGEAIKASVSSNRSVCTCWLSSIFAGGKAAAERKGTRLSLLCFPPFLAPERLDPARGTDRILNWIRQLYEGNRQPVKGCRLQLLFQELLNGIAQEYEAGAERKSAQSGIELAIAHMKANFRSKLDMGTVADIANLTLSSFSRLFKKTTGESPIEYLTKLRMDSAKSLLSQKKCTIKTVSSAVGYEDEFHFSRMFHRHVGVPPTFYRKVKKLRVAVAASLPYRDSLLSFGVEPVASVNLFRYPGMAVKEYELVFASQWEELERAKPDLIIGDFYHFSFRIDSKGSLPYQACWRIEAG